MENFINENGNIVLDDPLNDQQFKNIINLFMVKNKKKFICVELQHRYVHDLRTVWKWSRSLGCELYIKDANTVVICKAGVKPPKKSEAVMTA